MRVNSFGRLLSAAILGVAMLSAPLRAQTGDLVQRFKDAEELATKGLYDASKKAFARIAKDFPTDELGREAAERAKDNAFLKVETARRTGDSANRADVIFLGDGYTEDPRHQFSYEKMVEQTIEGFLRAQPYTEYAGYINWWRMNLSSAESRLDTPTREANTVLGGGMSKFSQGQVTVDRGIVKRFMQKYAPFADTALAMVKQGSLGTGGGDVAVFGPGDVSTAIHEFGHSFGGLLDEYTSQVELHPKTKTAGLRGINLTDSTRLEDCPWRHWIEAKAKGIGFWEGGAGRSRGVWHPSNQGCIMSASGGAFCIVCREAMVLAIYKYAKPIDASFPEGFEVKGDPAPDGTTAPVVFSVTPLKPKTHFLTVEWTVDGAPVEGRREVSEGKVSETLKIEPGSLLPGAHKVVASVKDPTPWVLKDEKDRLKQAREWMLTVTSKP